MRSVVVDSPADVVEALLTFVAARQPTQFVDYGCGRGEVLMRIAERFSQVPCIGIEFDDGALSIAQRRIGESSVENVRLIQADVLDSVDLAEDVAYLYLGGALNQRLGLALLEHGCCTTVIAVRYPITGAVPVQQIPTKHSTMYIYNRATTPSLVEWDAVGTVVHVPPHCAYLMSRAIRVGAVGHLELDVHAVKADAAVTVRAHEFGLSPSRPGVPTVLDVLIEQNIPRSMAEHSVIELSVALSGQALRPSHFVVVVPTAEGPPHERPIYDKAELQALLDSLPYPANA